jgi:hypothetical protein
MFKQGIALAAFEVDAIEVEAKRLKKHGVKFTRTRSSRVGKGCDFFQYLRQPDPDVPAVSEESLISDSALFRFRCEKTCG